MRKISDKTMAIIKSDPFYLACCLCGGTPAQLHHNLIFGGKQCDDWFTILPLDKHCHDTANERSVRTKLNRIMVARGGKLLNKYAKIQKYKTE